MPPPFSNVPPALAALVAPLDTAKPPCPNCGSGQYEIGMVECCTACGIFFDHNRGTGNQKYLAMLAKRVGEAAAD